MACERSAVMRAVKSRDTAADLRLRRRNAFDPNKWVAFRSSSRVRSLAQSGIRGHA